VKKGIIVSFERFDGLPVELILSSTAKTEAEQALIKIAIITKQLNTFVIAIFFIAIFFISLSPPRFYPSSLRYHF
jgi:hypothetical protein